ncbi:MAG: hypothetical protein M3517_05430, partial [Actinomycetota bacterium]|nr:hypothetical protein [Actinomycetota bacterium]
RKRSGRRARWSMAAREAPATSRTRREEKAQRTTSPLEHGGEGSASDESHAARGESAADDEPAGAWRRGKRQRRVARGARRKRSGRRAR